MFLYYVTSACLPASVTHARVCNYEGKCDTLVSLWFEFAMLGPRCSSRELNWQSSNLGTSLSDENWCCNFIAWLSNFPHGIFRLDASAMSELLNFCKMWHCHYQGHGCQAICDHLIDLQIIMWHCWRSQMRPRVESVVFFRWRQLPQSNWQF
jgi:hypothetical protein